MVSLTLLKAHLTYDTRRDSSRSAYTGDQAKQIIVARCRASGSCNPVWPTHLLGTHSRALEHGASSFRQPRRQAPPTHASKLCSSKEECGLGFEAARIAACRRRCGLADRCVPVWQVFSDNTLIWTAIQIRGFYAKYWMAIFSRPLIWIAVNNRNPTNLHKEP
jgi:hypothetical protein